MTICRLFGVRIILNVYFLVLLGLLSAVGLLWQAAIIFGIVFLHEMAHVGAARLYGLGVAEVELLPFGGVARIQELLEVDPPVEAKVALSGPAANAVLIGVALLASPLQLVPAEIHALFVQANAVIGGFNLIPALPLDGGRVYRAALAQRIGFRRATERAVRTGKACALLMVALGVILLPGGYAAATWIVVGILVYNSAQREEEQAGYVLMRYLARRRGQLKEQRWLGPHQVVVGEETPVKELLGHFVPQRYHIVWVLDREGRLVGIATELDVIDALFQRGIETPVGSFASSLRQSSG